MGKASAKERTRSGRAKSVKIHKQNRRLGLANIFNATKANMTAELRPIACWPASGQAKLCGLILIAVRIKGNSLVDDANSELTGFSAAQNGIRKSPEIRFMFGFKLALITDLWIILKC